MAMEMVCGTQHTKHVGQNVSEVNERPSTRVQNLNVCDYKPRKLCLAHVRLSGSGRQNNGPQRSRHPKPRTCDYDRVHGKGESGCSEIKVANKEGEYTGSSRVPNIITRVLKSG